MSSPWVHTIVTLRGWWLPGDARGFRSREHRLHSSGDYQNPPPRSEHAGLRAINEARSTRVRALTSSERAVVGTVFVERLGGEPYRLLALSVSATHVHALFSAGAENALMILGQAKRIASRRLGRGDGRMFGRGGGVDRIRNRAHQIATYQYILRHGTTGAWVWDFRGDAV